MGRQRTYNIVIEKQFMTTYIYSNFWLENIDLNGRRIQRVLPTFKTFRSNMCKFYFSKITDNVNIHTSYTRSGM